MSAVLSHKQLKVMVHTQVEFVYNTIFFWDTNLYYSRERTTATGLRYCAWEDTYSTHYSTGSIRISASHSYIYNRRKK